MTIEETIYAPNLKRHAPVAIAIVLIAVGMFALAAYGVHMTRPPFGDLKLRILCGFTPALLGILILVALVTIGKTYNKLTIVIRRDAFVYNYGPKTYRRSWRNISLTRPDINSTGPFASALLSDGEGFFRLYRFVYADFDQLLDEIEQLRLAARGSHRV